MTTISHQRIVAFDKTTWGAGPWVTEPDHKEWRDTVTGLPCIAHRNLTLGNWCGYVAVPPGHPAHGADYDSVDVEGHGGLTYASTCRGSICHVPAEGESGNVYWLGFDCGHHNDISPASAARDRERGWPQLDPDSRYRTLAYVEAHCASLAKQLAALAA